MRLYDSWKRSFEFLERKNISLFVLVTLKAIKTTYSQIFNYLLVPILFVLGLDMMVLYGTFSFMQSHVWQLAIWALRIFFLMYVYLSVRSSVLRKDWHYYKSYVKHSLYLLPVLSLVFVVLSVIGYWWWAFLTSFITFTALFFLDSCANFKNFLESHVRAAKMIIYNLPIYLIVSAMLVGTWWLYMFVVQAICHFVPIPIADASFLFIPVEACVLANLYIKWYHEQFDLYFNQPK